MTLTQQQINEALQNIGVANESSSGSIAAQNVARRRNLAEQHDAKQQTGFQEFKQDIGQTFGGLKRVVGETREKIGGIAEGELAGEENPFTSFAKSLGTVAGGVSSGIGELVKGGVKASLTQEGEEKLKSGLGIAIEKIVPVAQKLDEMVGSPVGTFMQNYKQLDDKTKRTVDSLLGMTGLAFDLATFGTTKKITEMGIGEVVKTGGKAIEQTIGVAEKGSQLAGKGVGLIKKGKEKIFGSLETNNVKDLILKTDDIIKKSPSEILDIAEKSAPQISLIEKWAGISPDIKKRISGKQKQLAEYFDISKARNLDDTLPTPLEYGTKNVSKAEEGLTNLLSNTGSEIGKFRNKIKTIKVGKDDLDKVMKTFDDQLARLNVGVLNGRIKQATNLAKKIKDSEIKTLQTLRNNLNKLKQSPTVENIIDNRMIFDNTINFAKSAKEVSGIVDPLSRKVRGVLAEINRSVIGKSQSKMLEEYSKIIEALNELQSYTGRRAGAEFLLKRVLSERGGSVREILATIKKYTGIDLMDDATMAQIATDLIGNTRQKGLFRQEITKAGLDAASLLGKSKLGAATTLLKKGTEKLIQPEKEFLKAAR
jgi:hypothetical protein